MEKQARRGFVPMDELDFGEKSIPILRKAAEENIRSRKSREIFDISGETLYIEAFTCFVTLRRM